MSQCDDYYDFWNETIRTDHDLELIQDMEPWARMVPLGDFYGRDYVMLHQQYDEKAWV